MLDGPDSERDGNSHDEGWDYHVAALFIGPAVDCHDRQSNAQGFGITTASRSTGDVHDHRPEYAQQLVRLSAGSGQRRTLTIVDCKPPGRPQGRRAGPG